MRSPKRPCDQVVWRAVSAALQARSSYATPAGRQLGWRIYFDGSGGRVATMSEAIPPAYPVEAARRFIPSPHEESARHSRLRPYLQRGPHTSVFAQPRRNIAGPPRRGRSQELGDPAFSQRGHSMRREAFIPSPHLGIGKNVVGLGRRWALAASKGLASNARLNCFAAVAVGANFRPITASSSIA
jgi:hypothetical protein